MGISAIIKLILACIALSLCIVKLVGKDKHTAVYWAFVTLYWTINFIDSVIA